MSNAWDEAAKSIESPFLKWADAPFELRFGGEPKIDSKHFINGRPEDCTGDDCALCSAGEKLDTSFKFDVTRYDNGDPEPKVMGLSKNAMRELVEVRNALGEAFSDTVFRCIRTGAGTSTSYKFIAVRKHEDEPIPF